MRAFLLYFYFAIFFTINSSHAKVENCNQSDQAVGIACLHCLSPNAKDQAVQIAEILRDSCRKNIAVSILMDNSFGRELKNIENIINISTSKGGRLKLYLYFGNGPWQRRNRPPSNSGFGTNIKPKQFRSDILINEDLKNEFKKNILASKDLLILNNSKGGSNFIIPILEDNLDSHSVRLLEGLVKEVLTTDSNNYFAYELGRNPCPNCYPGNDTSLSDNTFLDQHINSSKNKISVKNGLVTNDGRDFYFPWEEPKDRLSLTDIKKIISESKDKNNSFILWRAKSQGIINTNKLLPPENRNYPLFNPKEVLKLREILSEN